MKFLLVSTRLWWYFLVIRFLTFTPKIGKIVILKSNLLHFFSSPGAMLFIWAETFKAGYSAYSLQLYPLLGAVGWTGLQHRPQQCELLSVCGAMHQDPAGWGQEQEKKSEWALRANAVRGSHTRSFKTNKYILSQRPMLKVIYKLQLHLNSSNTVKMVWTGLAQNHKEVLILMSYE